MLAATARLGFMFIFGLIVSVALAQAPDWSMSFDMDQPPMIGGWQSPQTRHEVKDGILRIVDPSSEAGSGHCFQLDWQLGPEQEGVVEARLKVVSSKGDAGVCLWVSNGVNEEGVQFHTDGIDLAFSKLKHALDTTTDFHVYRVTLKGQDLKLYVDDRLAIDATGKATQPAHGGRSQFTFGSASSSAQGESLWDFVRLKSPLQLQQAIPVPNAEQITIFREPNTYAVFPGLAMNEQTEQLGTSFRAGGPKSHLDGQGSRSVAMVSNDGGKTWQEGQMTGGGKPFTGPNGRVVRIWCKWWQEHPAAKRDELKQQGYLVQDVRPGTVAICAGAMCSISNDNGKTWTEKEIQYPFMACLASGMNALQLADGTILYPVYGSVKAEDKDSSWLLRSTDSGDTWQFIQVGLKPDLHLNEPEIIECKSGRLLMVMRTGEGKDHLWQAISDDKGATWRDLKDTGVQGHPPDLLRLQDGRILLSYGFRHPTPGIRAVVSSDEGESWDLQHVYELRGNGGGTDLGYPHSAQLKDGTIVTVYYFFEPGGMQFIAATRWQAP